MRFYHLEEPILEPITEFTSLNSTVGFKKITLVEKSLRFNIEKRGENTSRDFLQMKNMITRKIAEYLLSTMKYSYTEEYDNCYVHTFKQDILIEKELNEFITKISELEIHNENLRDKNKSLKCTNETLKTELTKLEIKVEGFNKSNFWQRLKYLFKGEL